MKLHPFPAFGMAEPNVLGEQRNFAGILHCGIFSFPHQRKAPAGELNPDLVRPTGMQLNFQFAQVLMTPKPSITQACLLNSFSRLRGYKGHFSSLVPA